MLATLRDPGTLQHARKSEDQDPVEAKSSTIIREDTAISRSASLTSSPQVGPIVGSDTDSILFNFAAMESGRPYTFRFLGHWMLAIGDGDGGVAVYYLPNAPSPSG